MRAGPGWVDEDLVFTNCIGGALDPKNFSRRSFHPLMRRAGLVLRLPDRTPVCDNRGVPRPLARLKDLRHTCATLMLLAGIHPKIVSEMLGHASITIP
jgi:integrase